MTKLKKGSKGADVKALQEMLNKAGAKPRLKSDSSFGAKTEDALKAFQKKNRLKDDGVAGTKTMALLKKKGGGAAAKPGAVEVPKWPYDDYAKMLKPLEASTKSTVVDAKKTLMAMDQNLNNFDIEKIRDQYFDALRAYLGAHKKWTADAAKVIKFQKSYEKLAPRNPKAGPEIIKAASNTVKNMKKLNDQTAHELMRMMDLADDFKAMTTKKAA